MYLNIAGVRIHVGFAAAAFAAWALNSGRRRLYAIGFAGVLLHELTHLFLMRRYGCRRSVVEVLPGGVRISSDDARRLGYRQTLLVLLGAPAVNLVLGTAFLCARRFAPYAVLREAAAVNLALGAANLLPLSFLDGGRALWEYIAYRYGDAAAGKASAADGICCALLLAAAAALALRGIYPIPYYAFCLYCLVLFTCGKKSG